MDIGLCRTHTTKHAEVLVGGQSNSIHSERVVALNSSGVEPSASPRHFTCCVYRASDHRPQTLGNRAKQPHARDIAILKDLLTETCLTQLLQRLLKFGNSSVFTEAAADTLDAGSDELTIGSVDRKDC